MEETGWEGILPVTTEEVSRSGVCTKPGDCGPSGSLLTLAFGPRRAENLGVEGGGSTWYKMAQG